MSITKDVKRIVELQFKKWEVTKYQQKPIRATDKDSKQWTRSIVTISREPGCSSHPLGRILAHRFGFDLYGIEIIDLIAKSTDFSRQMVATLDEKTQSAFEDWISESFFHEQFHSKSYLSNLSKVVFSIAAHGKAVILGRGANFLLPPQDRLAIRLIAPLEARVKNTMREQNLSEQKSREYIKKIEQQRRSFIRKHFLEDITDPVNYDLVINTAAIKPLAFINIVKAALNREKPA
jgi:hypothetical protein